MILRQVSPAIAAWGLSLGVVLIGARRQLSAPRVAPSVEGITLRPLLLYLVILATGGVAALIGIELVFGVLIIGENLSVLASAATSGSLLAVTASAFFVLLSWARSRRAR